MQIATQPLAQSVRVQRKWQTLWKLSVPNFQWRAKIQKPGRCFNEILGTKSFTKKAQFSLSFLINRLLYPIWSILYNCYATAALPRPYTLLLSATRLKSNGWTMPKPMPLMARKAVIQPKSWQMFIQETDTYATWRKGKSSTQTWQTRYGTVPGRVLVQSSWLLCQKHLPIRHNLTFGTVRGESTTNEPGSPNDRSHEDQGRSG